MSGCAACSTGDDTMPMVITASSLRKTGFEREVWFCRSCFAEWSPTPGRALVDGERGLWEWYAEKLAAFIDARAALRIPTAKL